MLASCPLFNTLSTAYYAIEYHINQVTTITAKQIQCDLKYSAVTIN